LRKYILQVKPTLVENIKWNAPNYEYNDVDRITFSLLNKENKVKIILHKGAKEKEDRKAKPIFQDSTNLIQWNSNIRGTLTFDSLQEIEDNYKKLIIVFEQWLKL